MLDRQQSIFVDKMSELVLRESSDSKNTSSDEELDIYRKEGMDFTRHMQRSEN